VLRVKDPERMKRFYVEVLGLTVERRADRIGLVQLRAGAQLVDLVDAAGMLGQEGGAPPAEGGRNLDHFCFNVADFDLAKVVKHLEAHGRRRRRERPPLRRGRLRRFGLISPPTGHRSGARDGRR
jgi:glyoxylase I family protein